MWIFTGLRPQNLIRDSFLASKIMNAHFILFWCLVNSTLWISCQDTAPTPRSLSFELSSCLGSIENEMSCARQLLGPLLLGDIGCWVISGRTEDGQKSTPVYRSAMTWDGRQLIPVNNPTEDTFPFIEGDRVRMALFLFNTLRENGARCSMLTTQERCDQIPECYMGLKRNNLTLTLSAPMGFQDENTQCIPETAFTLDDRCLQDPLVMCPNPDDDRCTPVCVEGVSQPCEVLCGEGWRLGTQTCVANQFDDCIASRLSDEICDGIDNNCDGEVDEGCTCLDGDRRVCVTACGEGNEICTNNTFQGCDAPQPSEEICDGEDNNCNGEVDEGCPCIEGATRPCSSLCGEGTEVCENSI